MPAIVIRKADGPEITVALTLIEEYYNSYNVDVRDDQVASHIGFWLAYCDADVAGCVSLRPLPGVASAGEIKRMFVRPNFRGLGVAKLMLSAVESFAVADGMQWLYLDTMQSMQAAQQLYAAAGYQPCQRYNQNPQAALYFRKDLSGHTIVRSFQPGDEEAFARLNEAWIEKYFRIEDKDREMLRHPQEYILSRGGQIFMAVVSGNPVGCCALIPMQGGTYELSKMGVAESERGRGIGRILLNHTIAEAKRNGIRRLYLETNNRLGPAIHLYEDVGFTRVPTERVTPSPYERANVFMEMDLAS